MATKIYISRQVTGLPVEQVTHKFEAAVKRLAHKNRTTCVNPVAVCEVESLLYKRELTYKEAMLACIEALANCDAIYMLNDWRRSKGANAELAFAQALGLKVIYEPNW